MKICKTCHCATDDDKLRCPNCGDLFDDEMDSLLAEMKSSLSSYKEGVTRQSAAASQALPAPQPAAQASAVPAPASAQSAAATEEVNKELKDQLLQMQAEIRSLSSQMDKAQKTPAQQQPQPIIIPVTTAQQPAAQQPTIIYHAYPLDSKSPIVVNTGAADGAGKDKKDELPMGKENRQKVKRNPDKPKRVVYRSPNRIVLSVIALLALAASIVMFFLPWISITPDGGSQISFTGLEALNLYTTLFKEGIGANLDSYITTYITVDIFGVDSMVTEILVLIIMYILTYTLPVYLVFLILGFPLIFSMFGKVRAKGWHLFTAWVSVIFSVIYFLIFFFASGFYSMTYYFLIGAGCNVVRAILLLFYSKDKEVYYKQS